MSRYIARSKLHRELQNCGDGFKPGQMEITLASIHVVETEETLEVFNECYAQIADGTPHVVHPNEMLYILITCKLSMYLRLDDFDESFGLHVFKYAIGRQNSSYMGTSEPLIVYTRPDRPYQPGNHDVGIYQLDEYPWCAIRRGATLRGVRHVFPRDIIKVPIRNRGSWDDIMYMLAGAYSFAEYDDVKTLYERQIYDRMITPRAMYRGLMGKNMVEGSPEWLYHVTGFHEDHLGLAFGMCDDVLINIIAHECPEVVNKYIKGHAFTSCARITPLLAHDIAGLDMAMIRDLENQISTSN